jgi:hypothetical protein
VRELPTRPIDGIAWIAGDAMADARDIGPLGDRVEFREMPNVD